MAESPSTSSRITRQNTADEEDKEALVEFSDPISNEKQEENNFNEDQTNELKAALTLDKLSQSQILENPNQQGLKTIIGASSPSKNDLAKAPSQDMNAKSTIVVTPSNEKKEIMPAAVAPQQRKYINEDTSNPNWFKHKKHVFVLSSSGKPIYSRYGDEQILSPFMASLTAMVSFVNDLKDDLRYIVAGKHKFVFLVKGPLILVSISSTSEPHIQLLQQLNYVHSQIYSMLTSGVNQIFEKRPTFDLRGLLGGADKFWDNMISLMDHDPSFLLNSIHCLRMDGPTRANIGSVIQSAQAADLLFAVLMSKYQLISMVRPKKYTLQASDIHLIANFINSSTSFKSSVSWTPLCLPKFNDQGFLHSYVCFIAPEVCLLLISTKADSFYELANCKNTIVQGLTKNGSIDAISKAIETNYFYNVSDVGIPNLLHFLYKSKAQTQAQFTCPKLDAPYTDRHQQKRLLRLYQYVHYRVHRFKKSHKVYYQVSQYETIVGWVTNGFELFATFGPLESKSSCIKACNDILMWIKKEENSLFILNFPTW